MIVLYEELKELLISQKRPNEEIDDIDRAFEFAQRLHSGQYRVSEEPYIVHPIEVAKILAELKLDKNTIIAAFLHDILEDTDTKPEEIKELFGEDVLTLVQGVTKLGKYQFESTQDRQAENFRKMLLAMAKDVRVIFLKLADRLHNMRTLNYMAQNKQKRIAQETLDIFSPLANRLGIGKIKAELEDLSLRYINPEKYYEIAKDVAQTKAERDRTIAALVQSVKETLKQANIQASVYGRAKHYYSIYMKLERLKVPFEELYDISAVRVIVDTEKDCYNVLGLIHSKFKPIPGRFKDYIAMPKGNGYRSLHTSVIGPKSKPVEIQIRTQQMHDVAEYGVAAHWKYKESGSVKVANPSDLQFAWMRKLVELDKDAKNSKEFLESVKLDLFSDQVFAFTPMGDVIDLPLNSTPVDFAYRIHTEIGHRTVGALVNGRIVPLSTKLVNGDIVEILTSKQYAPKLDWLNFVVTKSASSKVRQWFKKNNKEDNINIGRQNMEITLTKAVFDELMKTGEFERCAHEMNYKTADDLFASIGYGETTINKVANKLKKPQEEDLTKIDQKERHHKKHSKKDDIIGLEGMLWTLAKCCSPIPGEPIAGVVTRNKGVTVHRLDCKCLHNVEPERIMDIAWADGVGFANYNAYLRIEVQDRIGALKDIIAKVSDTDTNIIYANSYLKSGKFGIIDIGVELESIVKLNRVIANLQSMPDVFSVKRLEQKMEHGYSKSSSKKKKPQKKPKSKES